MMTNTMLYLKRLCPSLSATERRLAEYILENGEHVPQTPMLDIATACGTSKPAVVRLCKKLGFSGYKEFVTTLSAEFALAIHEDRPDLDALNRESSAPDICRAVVYWTISALERAARQIDPKAAEQAAGLLVKAPRVDVCGAGPGVVAAYAAGRRLARLGINAYVSGDMVEQRRRASGMGQGDALLLLCEDGLQPDVRACAREARSCGGAVIGVFRSATQEALRECDVVIQYAFSEAPMTYCGLSSRTALLCAVDMMTALALSRSAGCRHKHGPHPLTDAPREDA